MKVVYHDLILFKNGEKTVSRVQRSRHDNTIEPNKRDERRRDNEHNKLSKIDAERNRGENRRTRGSANQSATATTTTSGERRSGSRAAAAAAKPPGASRERLRVATGANAGTAHRIRLGAGEEGEPLQEDDGEPDVQWHVWRIRERHVERRRRAQVEDCRAREGEGGATGYAPIERFGLEEDCRAEARSTQAARG